MNVDFNNLRRQACIAYDKLCEKLNQSIDDDGMVSIGTNGIQDEMDELRQFIGIIAMVYEENDDEKINVYAELYPEGQKMLEFNLDNS